MGGALALGSAHAEIRDCELSSNRAIPWQSTYAGGGAVFGTASSLAVYGSVFEGNSVNGLADEGGAILLNENPAQPFLVQTTVTIVDSVFSDNSVLADGGAMKLIALDTVTIDRCLIEGNRAGQGGGLTIQGPYVFPNTSTATISNSIISRNEAMFNYGGVSVFLVPEVMIRNSCIVDNRITTLHPLITSTYSGVFNNGSALDHMTVENTILWGNSSLLPNPDVFENQLAASLTSLAIHYNDIEGNVLPNNIGADPRFVDPDRGNYRLQLGSPAIDAGDPAYTPLPGELDFYGHPRVLGPAVDMGAAEWKLNLENRLLPEVPDPKVAF